MADVLRPIPIGQSGRGLEGILSRLGQAPDTCLAAEVGCPPCKIQRLRALLRIPAYDRMERVLPHLGRVPDMVLARHFGLGRETVRRRRERLGIRPASLRRYRADILVRRYVAEREQEQHS